MAQPPSQIGPYQIFEEIGRGGMSIVYRARDTRDGHIVALKVLPPELHHQDQLLNRFVKEGQSTLRLVHPNIVRTSEADLANGTYYIAMEFVQGENLSQYLKLHPGPLPFNEAMRILRQVASGLDYAHAQGILHRDIKPSNILLNHDGRAQITDFGVARDLGTDHTMVTMPGHSIGTPSYMSPEQARGDLDADSRSDIYSLGVVAYALLTGKMPFEASSHLSLLRKIIDDAPTAPETINPQINPGVASALKSVLAKDPQARYATATTFVTALEAGMAAGTVAQRSPISDATVADLLVTPPSASPSDATVSVLQSSRRRRSGNPLLIAAARARRHPANASATSKPIARQYLLKTTGAQAGKGVRARAYVLGAALLLVVALTAFLLRDRLVRPIQVEGTAVALATTEPGNTSTPPPPTSSPASTVSDEAIISQAATISDSALLSESVDSTTATPIVEPTRPNATALVRIAPAPIATSTPLPPPTSTPTDAAPTPLPTSTTANAIATATRKPPATSTEAAVQQATVQQATNTSLPSPTVSPTPLPTATPTPSLTEALLDEMPEPGATRVNEADGAVYAYVPAGKFSMGSTRQDDEKPLHAVEMRAFWMMQTEVTNGQYALCVVDGACTPPLNELMDNPDYATHPVVNVAWSQANDYAAWVGGRLPTEAEWEKAARGNDLRPFPWGESAPDATLLNFDSTLNDTTPAANYPLGVSPYGLYDMAGNVEEWVQDWYADDYYAASPAQNPSGPDEGIFRVVRGGSYRSDATLVLATTRGKAAPNRGYASVGFRVVIEE